MNKPHAHAIPGDAWRADARPDRQAYWMAGVLFVVWACGYLDRNLLTLLVPALKRSMGLSDVQVSLLQGLAFSLFFVVASVPLGRLADQYSRRMILFWGVIGWSLVTVATGFAESFGALFAARVLSGVGEACILPASVSLISNCFPPALRGRMMGLLLGGGSLGIASSTLLGGLFLDAFSERPPSGIFAGFEPWQLTYIAVGLPGLAVAMLMFTVREPVRPRSVDEADSVALAGLRQLLAGRWMMLVSLFVAFALGLAMAYGSAAWFATLLMREFNMRPGHVGVALGVMHLLVGGLGPILGGWISDALSRRFPRFGRLHFLTAIFVAQALVGLGFLVLRTYWGTIGINSVSTLFSTFMAASGLVVMSEAVPARARARTIAMYQLVTALVGAGLGPLAIAMVTDVVFADEARLRESMSAVLIGTSVLGVLLVQLAIRRRAVLP